MKGPIVLLLAIVAGVLAGPVNVRYNEPSVCARTCTESSKFKYQPGTTYVFDYNVQSETSMEGASEEKAVMGIKAIAHVEVISKCDMALRLSDVRLFPNHNSDFANTLEDQALRFSFQDGTIEDLCPVDGEPDWALNIKRGILSTFQNSMDNLEQDQTKHETDVTGKCPTEYKLINKGWYTKAIKKTKNLLGCMDRHGWRSAIQASPYRIPSELQSLPLMKSEHVCDQEVETRGYVKSTICKETHVFRPFSHYNNGSATKILQKLTYRNQVSQTTIRPSTVNRRTTMLFTHSQTQASNERNQKLVEAKLTELCTRSKEDIRPEIPELFSELVVLMRTLDATTLRDIYRQAERGAFCSGNTDKTKKFFLDAIPMVSTSGSVQLLKELLISKTVTGTEADLWLTSLALIQSPTREMISEVKAILSIKELEDKSMLPITSLVNNYCSKNARCSEEYEVTGIIVALQRNLGYGCYVRDENLEKVLLTLRAIGNAGHSESVADPVSNCFTRQSNPTEVRVTALDAYRRLPCSIDRSEPLSILRDTDEDSEVRIGAYLAIMKCPTEDLIKDVRSILEAEENNQVGSFIWSHLTNLKETSSPHKQSIRYIVDDEKLQKSFDLERFKYSRNYEGSFMLESFNTGAMAEGNVIWSSKSFIPRSAMVNLTVDLFGSSVNLFEIGGRVENLEYLIETYIDLFGYFGEKNAKKSIAKSREQLDKLRGSIYMRMFGNEMAFKHFKGLDDFKSDKFNYLDFLIKMSKEHDYSFSQSMMFLDSSIIIPTTSGLPLNLTVTGVSSMDLKASGSVDLRKVSVSPRSLNIDGTIKPSGAVTITGAMTVDAYVTKTGMKMTSTLHSSTEQTGRIRLERGKILEIVFDMPRDKMEILDVQSRFYTVNGAEEKEQAMITENRKQKSFCTGNKLAKILGVEVCGELKFPNASHQDAAPYFPFTGPVSMSLVLHKRDSHAGYKLLAKRVENKEQSIAQIAFDTPGSRVKRAIAMDAVLNFPNKNLEVTSTTPWTEMALSGKVINEDKQKAFIGTFTKDGDKYSVQSVVDVENNGPVTKLSPRIEIVRPRSRNIILAGSVEIEGTKRFDTDLSLIDAISHPISLKGTIVDTMREKSIEGRLQFDESGEYTILSRYTKSSNKKGTILRINPTFMIRTPTEHVTNIEGRVDYNQDKHVKGDLTIDIKKALPKPIEIKFSNVMKEDKRKNQKYNSDVFIGSKWLTGKIDSTIVLTKSGGVNGRVSIDYKLPNVKKNKVILSGKLGNRSSKILTKYNVNINCDVKKNPEYNWVTSFDMAHKNKHTDATLNIKYGKDFKDKTKMITFSTDVNHKGSISAGSFDYKLTSIIPALDVDLDVNGDHKHDRKALENNMKLSYGKGKVVQSTLKLRDGSKNEISMGAELDLKYPGHQIAVDTSIDQKKTEYTHNINFKLDKKKSTITTTYSNPSSYRHEAKSDFFIHSFDPITVSGMVNLNSNKFKSNAEFNHGGKKYGFVASKYSKDKYNHNLDAEVYYPGRKVSTDLTTDISDDRYTGKASVNWDQKDKKARVILDTSMLMKSLNDMDGTIKLVYPDKTITINAQHKNKDMINSHVDVAWSPREQIDLDFSHSHTNDYRQRNIGTTLSITTPFSIVPKITTEMTYSNDHSGIRTTSQVSWGRDMITTNTFVQKPISTMRLEAHATATTPFKGFRRMNAEINHKFLDKFHTVIKGSVEETNAVADFQFGLKGNPEVEIGVDSKLGLKSNIKGMESMSININHLNDDHKYTTDVVVDHNGDQYIYDLDMTLNRGWKFENVGKLMLVTPYKRITTDWNHMFVDGTIKSTITSDWGRGRKVYIDFIGSHENFRNRKIDGKLIFQSPWKPVRDIELNLNNEYGYGMWNHISNFKIERRILGSNTVNYRRGAQLVTFNVAANNPYTDNISGSMSVSRQMPYNGRMEVEWAPGMKISADGAITGTFPTNVEGTMRLATPFTNFQSIVATASNKKESGEWITNGHLDYGARKSIQVETRLGNRKARVLILTPYEVLRRLDTGIAMDLDRYEFNGRADFEALPAIGKFSTSLNANWGMTWTAKARLDTPFRRFPYAQIEASSNEDNKGRHSKLEIEYSPRQIITMDTHYSLDDPVLFSILMKSPFTNFENVGANLRHAAKKQGIETTAEIILAPYKKVDGTFILAINENGIETRLTVNSPFRGYESTKYKLIHVGAWTDFTTKAEVEAYNKKMDADVMFNLGPTTSATITVHTPFEGYEEMKATMQKKGELNNLNIASSVIYGRNQEVSLDLVNQASPYYLKTDFNFNTPYTSPLTLNIDHVTRDKYYRTKASTSFGRDNKLETTTLINYQLPKIDISSDVEYLFAGNGKKVGFVVKKDGYARDMTGKIEATCDEHKATLSGNFKAQGKMVGSMAFTSSLLANKDISVSFSHEGPMNRFQSEGNMRYLDTEMSGKINWYNDGLRQINSMAEISTPFRGFEQMNYDYQHALGEDSFTGNGKVGYGYNQEIIGDVAFTMVPVLSGSATLKTPYSDYRNSRIAFNGEGSMTNFKVHAEGELFGERLDVDSNLSHDSVYKTSGLFDMKGTSKKIRDVTVSFGNSGSAGNFDATADVMYAGQKIMEGKFTSVRRPSRSAYNLNLQGLYMEDLSASFEHTGTPLTDCHTKIRASLGNDCSASYDSNIATAGDSVDVELKGEYNYYDMRNKASLNLKKEGQWTQGKMSIDGSLYDDQASASLSTNIRKNNIEIGAIVKTPFDGFRDLAANLDYADRRQHIIKTMMRYMDGKEISSETRVNLNDWKRVNVVSSVDTPFQGYESSSLRYQHALDDSSLKSSIKAKYGRNQEISSKLEIESAEENKFEIEVESPFSGFRDTKFSAKMNKNRSTPSAAVVLTIDRSNVHSLQGELDLTSSPIHGGIHLTTPYREYRKSDITFTHSGEWTDFRSSVTVNTQPTGSMEGEISFFYNSPKSLGTTASFKSEFENFEDLSFSAKNTPNGLGLDSTMMVEWAPMKKIEIDSSYSTHKGWSSVDHGGTLTMTTPFESMKSAVLKMSNSKTSDKYSEKLFLSQNDVDLIDMNLEADLGEHKDITLNVDKPQPMQVTLNMQKAHAVVGELFVNWNKEDPQSNVRFRSSFTPNGGRFEVDKEFEMKLIHPVRTMGVSGTIQTTDNQIKSKGALLWNENKGQRLGYDLDLSSNERRRKSMKDASLKINLPTRSLVFTGAVQKTPHEKSVDGSIMWDASVDQTKKVGVKASYQPGSKTNKMDVVLSLPTMNRDIRVGSEMTVDNGQIIFDGKTEFSYSPDSRKTVIFTSNLKDVSYDRNLKNYTMSLGISHAYTNTDLFVTSHVGQSSDRLSTGMSMQYLTASRRRLNMMLLGEIDQLRRRINIDVISPLKRVQVVGEVDSLKPFHASLQNHIDDQPGVSAELSVNCEEKTLDFQAKYDPTDLSNTFHIQSRYPNRTAIRAEAFTMKSGRRIVESIMSMRLNTSRILHTKVTWRPQIQQEIQAFAVQQFASMGEEMAIVQAEVGAELASKYNRIAHAATEELKPLFEMIQRELAEVDRELQTLMVEMRRMYGRMYMQSQTELQRLIATYRTQTAELTRNMMTWIQTIQNYPIKEQYFKSVQMIQMYSLSQMERMIKSLNKALEQMKQTANVYSDKVTGHIVELKSRIANHHSVQGLQRKIAELQKINYSKYISDAANTVGEQVGKLNLPEKYNAVIYNVHSMINKQLDDIMQREEVKYLHSVGNEVYQQGKWAYGYWRVEENVKNEIQQLIELVKEMVKETYNEYKKMFALGPLVNVTVYDPIRGEFQADTFLPIPLESLDSLPRDCVTNYINDARDIMESYLPSKDTVVQMYNDYFPQTNNTEPDEFKAELNDYLKTPKRRMRNLRRRRRGRN